MFFRVSVAASIAYLYLWSGRFVHDDPRAAMPPPPPVLAPPAPYTTRVVDVRRADLDAMASVAGSARVVPTLTDGVPAGIKLYAIRPGSLLATIGLENGDTVRAINDVPVTSPDAALEVYRPLRAPDHFDLDVLRRGEEVRIVVLVH